LRTVDPTKEVGPKEATESDWGRPQLIYILTSEEYKKVVCPTFEPKRVGAYKIARLLKYLCGQTDGTE